MTLTITIDQNKACAKCGAMGATQSGLCLECISRKLKGREGKRIMAKNLKERVKAGLDERGLLIKPGQQPNLFGERDFIVNTLETERKMLQDEVEATMSSIQKKEEKLDDLKERIENISSSIESIRKAAKTEGKKDGKANL